MVCLFQVEVKRAEPREKNASSQKHALSTNASDSGSAINQEALRQAWIAQNAGQLMHPSQSTTLMAMTAPGSLWAAVTPGFNWMSPVPAFSGYPCWTSGGLNSFPPSVWNPTLAVAPNFSRSSSLAASTGQSPSSGMSSLTQIAPQVAGAVTLSSIPLLNTVTPETAQEVTSFGNTHRLMTFPAFNDIQSPVSLTMTGSSTSRVPPQTHAFHPYRRV